MPNYAGTKRLFHRGWHFKDGKLLMFEDAYVLVLRGWPDVRAWIKRPGTRWLGTRPKEPLLSRIDGTASPRFVQRVLERFAADEGHPVDEETLERMWVGLEARSAAARAFRESIPAALWARARLVSARQWHLLALLTRVPGAEDIARDNLALAVCLASAWAFADGPVVNPYAVLRRKVRRRRVDIADWLGFPARPAAVRILAKVHRDAALVEQMFYLRAALRRGEVPKPLLHLPALDRGVLRIATDPALLRSATQGLLEEMLGQSGRSQNTAYLLKDACEMARDLELRLPPFRSTQAVQTVHDELMQVVLRRSEAADLLVEVPEPPFPGTDDIVPLTTPRDIAEEGRVMHHCVAAHIREVSRGYEYIYRILAPERATLGLRLGRGGWAIGELKAPRNASVGHATIAKIRDWLAAQGAAGRHVVLEDGWVPGVCGQGELDALDGVPL